MITSVGKSVENRELLYTVARNINWQIHYGKQCGGAHEAVNSLSSSTPKCILSDRKKDSLTKTLGWDT